MHIDDIVNELMKENTPEFTKWTLHNVNADDNIPEDEKQYTEVHGVRILTAHFKNKQDNSIVDLILWMRLTTLKTETDEVHEFWVQAVLTPSEAQQRIIDFIKEKIKLENSKVIANDETKDKVAREYELESIAQAKTDSIMLTMVNELNSVYISGTLCYLVNLHNSFAYIQKSILPDTNQMDYAKKVIMYAISRGIPIIIAAIDQKLYDIYNKINGNVVVNRAIITLSKTADDFDKNHNYFVDNEDSEDLQKFIIWMESLFDAASKQNEYIILDINDFNVSSFVLNKLITVFKTVKAKYDNVKYLFYDSSIIGDKVFDLYKNVVFKEFLKVFTAHEIDTLSNKEFKDLCVKYHREVSDLVVNMLQVQEQEENK